MNKRETLKQQEILSVAHHDFNRGLNSYAFFKVNDHSVEKDLVQETFLKTWKYLVRGGKIDTLKAFLYHVLNNLIVDEYRKHKTISLDTLTENGFEPSVDQTESKRFINVIDGKVILLMIPRLPDTYKKIMHMRFVQDLSLKEISLITGQTRNSIAVKIHRGIEKLKVLYGAHAIT